MSTKKRPPRWKDPETLADIREQLESGCMLMEWHQERILDESDDDDEQEETTDDR